MEPHQRHVKAKGVDSENGFLVKSSVAYVRGRSVPFNMGSK